MLRSLLIQLRILDIIRLFRELLKSASNTGRVAERTSSRLRRTNDRSVLGVISSDAEHARQVSYASKRKYKLDLSSLHEDHEDDKNAEIGVPHTLMLYFCILYEKLR
jgi:hypothetical protein